MRRIRRLAVGTAATLALAGAHGALASAATGSVLAAGENNDGQLGNGTQIGSSLPTPVSGLSDVISVEGHAQGALALLSDGTVDAWGSNEVGQLGNGSTEPSLFPTPVSGLSEVTALSSYGQFCLALLANGTVVSWGLNDHGQLGDGTTENRLVPVPVSGLSNVVAIAAGEAHSLALLGNGTVMAWGSNAHGQLGVASSAGSTTPIPIEGLSGVTAIAAGEAHSLALTSAGAVWAWGENAYGQLGNGNTTNSSVPGTVSGLPSNVVAISGGARHSIALLADGTVKAWGGGEFGQLGNGSGGSGTHSLVPVAVKHLSGVTSISTGKFANLALLANKTIAAWGGDEFGQLGNGESGLAEKSLEPVMVCGVLEAGGVSEGSFTSFFYGVTSTAPCPAVTKVSPEAGPHAGGTTVTITGSGFTGATAVEFGPFTTTNFTVDSPTQITAVTPPAGFLAPGNESVYVRVRTPAGTSPRSNALFAYKPPPSIEKLSPRSGPAGGGTKVTIYGSNFAGENVIEAVKFGGVNATSFELVTIKNRREISAIAPPHAAGTNDVTVTTQWGTSALSTADHFKFVPTVSGVTPSSGPKAGGQTVTIAGAGFAVGANTTLAKFGTAKSKSVNCSSTSECTALVPAHAAGTVDVKVTANKVPSKANPPADRYTYE
jgi:alpha-tubulin suppressor-like RCC1 family protein